MPVVSEQRGCCPFQHPITVRARRLTSVLRDQSEMPRSFFFFFFTWSSKVMKVRSISEKKMHLKKKKKRFSYPPSVVICSLWRLVLMQTFTSNYYTFTLRFIQRITRKHAVTCLGYKSNSRVLCIDANYNGTTSWHNYLGIHYIEKDIMCVSTKKPSAIGNAAIEIAVLISL